ncbi:hypothetical protein [Stratiformator vulcanicus]|uniref:Uncharacterized protein n=1 Tax=Stratiformator vulcanicus TaxID=2527980 RepID=A0A517R6A0_9PLAN|nr:hypothetical protein [Stratiformator vulcanicus]QDT39399.1 hypothetical protein Pan189_38060 [Stratiformator vulcanicus]
MGPIRDTASLFQRSSDGGLLQLLRWLVLWTVGWTLAACWTAMVTAINFEVDSHFYWKILGCPKFLTNFIVIRSAVRESMLIGSVGFAIYLFFVGRRCSWEVRTWSILVGYAVAIVVATAIWLCAGLIGVSAHPYLDLDFDVVSPGFYFVQFSFYAMRYGAWLAFVPAYLVMTREPPAVSDVAD